MCVKMNPVAVPALYAKINEEENHTEFIKKIKNAHSRFSKTERFLQYDHPIMALSTKKLVLYFHLYVSTIIETNPVLVKI